MNIENDAVSRSLGSPDATPASTWNRGNAYRHLALAGWDPDGMSEVEHLEQAIEYLTIERDRVKTRDDFLAEKHDDTESGYDPEAMYNTAIQEFRQYRGNTPVTVETRLPNCDECGQEMVQDPNNSYRLICPNPDCPSWARQQESDVVEPRVTHYAPLPSDKPPTAFQRYMAGPSEPERHPAEYGHKNMLFGEPRTPGGPLEVVQTDEEWAAEKNAREAQDTKIIKDPMGHSVEVDR